MIATKITNKATSINSIRNSCFTKVPDRHTEQFTHHRGTPTLNMADAYWRRKAATQLAKDKASWFGADWEAKQDADNDKSNQACRDDEFPEIFQKLEDAGCRLEGATFYPGAGYMADDPAEQAVFRKQLEVIKIDWNKPSTRCRLDIGPKNEMALEHEGFTAAEVAARFTGESVELGGEFDGEQTIVAVPRSTVPRASKPLSTKEIEQQDSVEEDGDVEMEDAETGDGDDAKDDEDSDPLA